MLALTQCWFTRVHIPERRPVAAEDGSHSAVCRHCAKRIVSWAKGRWHLADGFNVTHLAETCGTRYLYIVDTLDDLVIARFPVNHLESEAGIKAYAMELRIAHRIDEAGSGVALRDSREAV